MARPLNAPPVTAADLIPYSLWRTKDGKLLQLRHKTATRIVFNYPGLTGLSIPHSASPETLAEMLSNRVSCTTCPNPATSAWNTGKALEPVCPAHENQRLVAARTSARPREVS